MTDNSDKVAIVLSPGGQPPSMIKRVSEKQAFIKLLEILKAQQGAEFDENAMDTALAIARQSIVYESDDSPDFSGTEHELLAKVFDDKSRPVSMASEEEPGDPLGQELDGVNINCAFFRRAEGLCTTWDLVSTGEEVHVQRADGINNGESRRQAEFTMPAEVYRLLSALSVWTNLSDIAKVLDKEPNWIAIWLERLCRHRLVWYSDKVYSRTLPGCVHLPEDFEKVLALVPSCAVFPLISNYKQRDKIPVPMPFMPRMGDLDSSFLAGYNFISYRRGHGVQQQKIFGDQNTGSTLRTVVALLDGRSTAQDIIDGLPKGEKAAGRSILKRLCLAGLVEPLELSPDSWVKDHIDQASATWLGHASVILQFADTRLWIDPLVFPQQHQPLRRDDTPPHVRGYSGCSAVLITHGDNDHLSPSTLARIDPGTPVIIPDCTQAGKWQVDIPGILKCFGFRDIRMMKPWEKMQIGDAVVTAIPFEGEDWGLQLSTLTYLVEGPADMAAADRGQARVYFGADSAGMAALGKKISGGAPIDLAFVGVSGNAEAHIMTSGFGYGEFYQSWIPAQRWARFTQLTDGPQGAAQLAVALNATRSFGYAAGGGSYIDTAYSDEGDHVSFSEMLQNQSQNHKPIDLEVGSTVTIIAGNPE